MKFTVSSLIDCASFNEISNSEPWICCRDIESIIQKKLQTLSSDDYFITENGAIHKTAIVENYAILKAPYIIGENCFVASFSYLRGGVWLGSNVILGPSTEIKSSFIFSNSKTAHFNFVGDSVIGNNVNIEAGAIIANYRNEKEDKAIRIKTDSQIIETKTNKFGSFIGDNCRIGANAVLAPGAILGRDTIVPRLGLVDQYP